MKAQIFGLFSFFFLAVCCGKEVSENEPNWHEISKNLKFSWQNGNLQLKSGKFSYNFKAEELPLKKVVFLNASLTGYVTELGLEDRIVGISSPEYIYSPKVRNLLAAGKIADVGNEQKYNVEKIISLKPDAVFTNYIATFGNTYEILGQQGIKVIFLDEYLEQQPLQKAAYLLAFGKLFGKEKFAEERFAQISAAYMKVMEKASEPPNKPLVLSNEMYGNVWYLPGGNTALANFIKDAGAKYILEEDKSSQAATMSFEEVFAKSQRATFWVNAGNHKSRQSLAQANAAYKKLPVFNGGKIFSLTARESGRANDFFESGSVRADLVLKDYVAIFHPELLPHYRLTYLKELK